MTKHIPVLQREALAGLQIKNGMTVVDATLGGGGYTRRLLELVGDTGRVIALDRDKTAIDRFETEYPESANKALLIHGNFAHIQSITYDRGIVPDAIVADLGISSDQLDDPLRGLSFLADGPLDMRLDQSGASDSDVLTAAHIIATKPIAELAAIFERYGDEPQALLIARCIVKAREEATFDTTAQLAQLISEVVPARLQRHGRHPATRVFQALRIAVNHEYEDLEEFLAGSMNTLVSGGHLSVVSFHSGEDRIVKHFMREQARGCVCPSDFPICQCHEAPKGEIITKKPISPSDDEVVNNPRARSAKLRVMQKI